MHCICGSGCAGGAGKPQALARAARHAGRGRACQSPPPPPFLLQESHGRAVACLEGYHADPCGYNLVASVGSTQLTVYDGEHLDDHVGVVAQYLHEPTPHARGGVSPGRACRAQGPLAVAAADGKERSGREGWPAERWDPALLAATGMRFPSPLTALHRDGAQDLTAVAWLHPGCLGCEPREDIMLAVGSGEADICIASLAQGTVVRQLQGPAGSRVLALAPAPAPSSLLAALHSCGSLLVWDLQDGSCVGDWSVPGALSLVGFSSAWLGGRRGRGWGGRRGGAGGASDGGVRGRSRPCPPTNRQAWAPDRDGLAAGGQRGKLWSLALTPGAEPMELPFPAQLPSPLTASIDCLVRVCGWVWCAAAGREGGASRATGLAAVRMHSSTMRQCSARQRPPVALLCSLNYFQKKSTACFGRGHCLGIGWR